MKIFHFPVSHASCVVCACEGGVDHDRIGVIFYCGVEISVLHMHVTGFKQHFFLAVFWYGGNIDWTAIAGPLVNRRVRDRLI